VTVRLADGLRLPIHVVTESVGILAKRRAGKSTTARRLAEQLHQAKQQVVVADPKGDWWGLLFARDGKAPGLPFIVLGGEHGHIPLEVGAGELVARMVVVERVSLVLDLSQFRKHEVATFMTAFMENLYRLKAKEEYRTPMMLIVDEADAIAPQKPQRGEERMLGAVEDLVRRGGQRGIGVTMLTQRSAVLNKNVLTQIGILIVLRTIAPQDLAAMDAWIDVHGTVEQRKELMASLPSLPTGTGWVWAPGWPDAHGIFQRVDFLLPETFDSSKTPGQSKTVVPKNAADVDLEAFQREMAATIAKAKADDPRELRRRIAELEKQLKSTSVPAAPKAERVEVPVLKDAQIARLEKVAVRFEALTTTLADARTEVLNALKAAAVHQVGLPRRVAVPRAVGGTGSPTAGNAAATRRLQPISANRRYAGVRGRQHGETPTGDLAEPEKRILDGLAWWEAAGIQQPSRHQTAFAARYSVNGHFNNVLGGLRVKGLVAYPKGDHVSLTDTGRASATAPDAPASYAGLVEMVDAVLRQEPQRRLFRALVEARESRATELDRETLAAMCNYTVNGHFNNVLGSLKGLGVMRYPRGNHVALGKMFEGLA
jgi:hypothetical protein